MRRIAYLVSAVLLLAMGVASVVKLPTASALTASSFQAGNIISDSVFTNYNAMSANDIQTFLSSQVPSCDTNGTQPTSHPNGSGGYYTRAQWGAIYDSGHNTSIAAAPYVCLKSYVENPTTHQNNLQNPSASIPGGMSAAQIIAVAAQQYQINPEVLITTIQKEQGLVTDSWPWVNEYQEAMGYDCPDSGQGCTGTFSGFYTQVMSAAHQFRNYLTNPNSFNYTVGSDNILYAPGCSAGRVVIQNNSTAALYDYTPYQPDGTVLANTNPTGSPSGPGPSVNDSCAAYGNRNFWWYFNTWFGSSIGDLVQAVGDQTVYLLSGTMAYPIHNVNVLNDLAVFGPVRQTTLGEINAYTGGPTLNGLVGASSGTLYLVNASIKLPFISCDSVADYGYACDSSQIPYLTDGQLSRLVNGPQVTPLMRASSNPTVYYVSGNTKRPIPAWSDVQSFHIPIMNTLTDAFVNKIPYSSAYAYGPGSLVKTLNSSTVYVVKDLNSLFPIDSFIYPQELGLNTGVRTIISSYGVLGNLENTLVCNGANYLATNGTAYSVSNPIMTDYGFNQNQFIDGGSLCSNISINSQALDQYIRTSDGTIYYVSGGQKQAFAGYSAYQAHGGTAANTVQVSDFFAGTLPTGSPITQ